MLEQSHVLWLYVLIFWTSALTDPVMNAEDHTHARISRQLALGTYQKHRFLNTHICH